MSDPSSPLSPNEPGLLAGVRVEVNLSINAYQSEKNVEGTKKSFSTCSVDGRASEIVAVFDNAEKKVECSSVVARTDSPYSSLTTDNQSLPCSTEIMTIDGTLSTITHNVLMPDDEHKQPCDFTADSRHVLTFVTDSAVKPGHSLGTSQVVEESVNHFNCATDKDVLGKECDDKDFLLAEMDELCQNNGNRDVIKISALSGGDNDCSIHKKKDSVRITRELSCNNGENISKMSALREKQVGGPQHKELLDVGSRCDGKGIEGKKSSETLMSFKERLIRKKRLDSLRKRVTSGQVVEGSIGKSSSRSIESKTVSLVALRNKVEFESAPSSSKKQKARQFHGFKNLVRELGQKALLEAGFRIELRPRRTKNYEDSVYVSPEGHGYWSLPNAWRAYKQSQAVSSVSEVPRKKRGRPCANSHKLGEEPHWDFKMVDKKHGGSSSKKSKSRTIDQTVLLAAAMERAGVESVKNIKFPQNPSKTELSNSQLVDLLLEDLKVLKRVTDKSKKLVRKVGKNLQTLPCKGREKKLTSSKDSKQLGASKNIAKILGQEKDSDNSSKYIAKSLRRKRESVMSKRVPNRKEDKETKGATGKRLKCAEDEILGEPDFKKGSVSSKEKLPTPGKREYDLWQEGDIRKCKKGRNMFDQVILQSEKRKSRKARSGFRLEVRKDTSRKNDHTDEASAVTKQTTFSWLIDRGVVSDWERWCYIDKRNNIVLKEGMLAREGILCNCCRKYYTSWDLETHAWSGAKNSAKNIVFSSGKSLVDCQIQAWEIEMQMRKKGNYFGVSMDDKNDDTCMLCGDGGDLLCCDNCPSTFHTSCLQMEGVPEGNWYCPKCRCSICGASQQCKEESLQVPNAILLCDQCEHRYHTSCLDGNHVIEQNRVFCRESCKRIYCALNKLVGISNTLDNGLSWMLLRCNENLMASHDISEFVVNYHSKLAVALLVMEECFIPMDDPRTNIDMIAHTLYNRWCEFDRLNYRGFYTVILERNGEIISVASIRVHGPRLAEMPLIGTREQYRRQGMCRKLVGVIEKILSSMGVAMFVLPAIPELLHTWIHAFGFMPLEASHRVAFQDVSMMMFPGTDVLQKPLFYAYVQDDEGEVPDSGLPSCRIDTDILCDAGGVKDLVTESFPRGCCLEGEAKFLSENLEENGQIRTLGSTACCLVEQSRKMSDYSVVHPDLSSGTSPSRACQGALERVSADRFKTHMSLDSCKDKLEYLSTCSTEKIIMHQSSDALKEEEVCLKLSSGITQLVRLEEHFDSDHPHFRNEIAQEQSHNILEVDRNYFEPERCHGLGKPFYGVTSEVEMRSHNLQDVDCSNGIVENEARLLVGEHSNDGMARY